MTSTTMTGLLSPVVTPFKADLSPDTARFIRHCKWLLSQNCGLAVFGTNSEGNSLSVEERMALLDALIDAGVDPQRMMPGTGCCSITDSVRLTAYAVSKGVGGALMLPPFYYKNVSDDGLFANFAEVIERVGDSNLKIYLYHFPAMSQVPFGLEVIGRLLKAYPDTVVGIKDSSADRDNLAAMLKEFPGFGVFAGTEMLLLDNMRLGGIGCISATANVNPAAIHNVFANWRTDNADNMQAKLNALRMAVQQFPMIPPGGRSGRRWFRSMRINAPACWPPLVNWVLTCRASRINGKCFIRRLKTWKRRSFVRSRTNFGLPIGRRLGLTCSGGPADRLFPRRAVL